MWRREVFHYEGTLAMASEYRGVIWQAMEGCLHDPLDEMFYGSRNKLKGANKERKGYGRSVLSSLDGEDTFGEVRILWLTGGVLLGH